MGVYETYSKRKRARERPGQPDVYEYDDLPAALRVQIVHIWPDAMGVPQRTGWTRSLEYWNKIHNTMARELGVFSLSEARGTVFDKCVEFILHADTEPCLDLIEISFRVTLNDVYAPSVSMSAGEAIRELNQRFREHRVGYQFEQGQIIRVDSQYLHVEVTKPTLSILADARYAGASEEFLKAHQHYRKGDNKEAISWALKAFESTLKIICERRDWSHPPGATTSKLIETVIANGLIPTELTQQFNALRATLESGLPVVRNRLGGHGQGATPVQVPDYLAAYALHLAGSNIQLLVEADESTG